MSGSRLLTVSGGNPCARVPFVKGNIQLQHADYSASKTAFTLYAE